MVGVKDTRGRPLRDLRISVTDRCNMRCRYCMPREVFGSDFAFLSKIDILTYEEIDRLAGLFISLGVEKVRLSGGELYCAKICMNSYRCSPYAMWRLR